MAKCAIFCMYLFLLFACESDKVLKARRLIPTEPNEAIALLQSAAKEKGPCFDCQIYLGMAYEKLQDLVSAQKAYEAALAMPEAKTRPEPVSEKLLEILEKRFSQVTEKALKLQIATEASQLETKLKVKNPWANLFLFDIKYAEFKEAIQKNNKEEALALVNELMSLYLPQSKKKQVSIEITDWLQKDFTNRAKDVFMTKLASKLEEEKHFDSEKNEIVVSNVFTIPTQKENSKFDPKNKEALKQATREAACGPLRKIMEDVVMDCVNSLEINKPSSKDIDSLFMKFYQYARAGFTTYGSEKWDKPAGQSYLCEIRVPLWDFLVEFYRFSQ